MADLLGILPQVQCTHKWVKPLLSDKTKHNLEIEILPGHSKIEKYLKQADKKEMKFLIKPFILLIC